MKLAHNWKLLAQKAWSFRLMVLAAILSGAEVVLPMLVDTLPVSPGIFAAMAALVSAAALLARLVAQQGISADSTPATEEAPRD